jgi:hypothetical protein
VTKAPDTGFEQPVVLAPKANSPNGSTELIPDRCVRTLVPQDTAILVELEMALGFEPYCQVTSARSALGPQVSLRKNNKSAREGRPSK